MFPFLSGGRPHTLKMPKKGKSKKSMLSKLIRSRVRTSTRKTNQKSIPISYGLKRNLRPNRMKGSTDDAVISGTDWANQVVLRVSNDKPGAVVADININPFTMQTTRLSKLAALYEFWEVIDFSVTYSGAVPVTQQGVLVGFFDYDTTDDLTTTSIATRNLEIAYGHKDTVKATKLYDKQTWRWNDKKNIRLKKLFCNPTTDPTTSSAGRFYLICENIAGVVTDVPIGTLTVSYKIRFHKPQIDDTLYGYGYKWVAGGTITGADPFGTVPVTSWSNLPVAKDPVGHTITLYPGNYTFLANMTGTVITGLAMSLSPAVTTILDFNVIASDQKTGMILKQFTTSSQTTMTYQCTATTITAGIFFLSSLPIDSVTLTNVMAKAAMITRQLNYRMSELKMLTHKCETANEDEDVKYVIEPEMDYKPQIMTNIPPKTLVQRVIGR